MRRKIIACRPPRIAMSLLFFAGLLHWATPLGRIAVFPSTTLAALLGLGGFAIMMKAWWQFRQEQVAICPTATTDKMICNGIYAYTRNPMYLGVVFMLAAVAVWIGTLPFFAAAVGFFLIVQIAFCPYEESKLRATFGAEYDRYANAVRRWC